jgi:acetyl-CoA synthetase
MPIETNDSSISVLSKETRSFEPPESFRKNAWANDPSIYEKAAKDPEGYWANWAKELEWFKPWNKVLEWKTPYAKWFIGGKINASVNCLDRHVRPERRNKAAILWQGEDGIERVLTYWDVYREVNKFANVLKELGIKRGDRVAIYLPMIPELIVSVLACARIGAIHSVVFGGFSADALRDRINDAEAKALITADGGYRRGQIVPLKHDADYALAGAPSVEKVSSNREFRSAGFIRFLKVNLVNSNNPLKFTLIHAPIPSLSLAHIAFSSSTLRLEKPP